MTALHTYLSHSASLDPSAFENAVGTAIVIEATALPSAILTNFPFEVTTQDIGWTLKDSWGTPFHLELLLKSARASGIGAKYEFSLRSNGPNRIDELGMNDDLSLTNVLLECPPFGADSDTWSVPFRNSSSARSSKVPSC